MTSEQSQQLPIDIEVYKRVLESELYRLREENIMLKVVNAQLKANIDNMATSDYVEGTVNNHVGK